MELLHEFSPFEFEEKTFKRFNADWALLSAGGFGGYNMMTVSWGGFADIWNKPCVFVRPQRYTFQFIERTDLFSLSFFAPEYRAALTK